MLPFIRDEKHKKGRSGCVQILDTKTCQAQKAENTDSRTNYAVKHRGHPNFQEVEGRKSAKPPKFRRIFASVLKLTAQTFTRMPLWGTMGTELGGGGATFVLQTCYAKHLHFALFCCKVAIWRLPSHETLLRLPASSSAKPTLLGNGLARRTWGMAEEDLALISPRPATGIQNPEPPKSSR